MSGEFKEQTKLTLAKRAGEKCSLCGIGTSQPHTDNDDFINLGEAAHIQGNKEGKHNRYNKDMVDIDRSDISNAMWLCRACHKKIDTDDKKYTVEFLLKTKAEHEERIQSGYYDKAFPDYNEQQIIDHDKAIFLSSQEIINEAQLNQFLNKLSNYSFAYFDEEELKKLNDYLEFHNLEGNKFLTDKFNSLFSNFRYSVNGMLIKLYSVDEKDKRHDSALKYMHIGEPYFVGMQPPPEFKLAFIFHPGDYYKYKAKYNLYNSQLKEQIKHVKNNYSKFRQLIKNTLYI